MSEIKAIVFVRDFRMALEKTVVVGECPGPWPSEEAAVEEALRKGQRYRVSGDLILAQEIRLRDQETWPEGALAIMREWDREAGITPDARESSGVDYADAAGDACNPGYDPDEWLCAIAADDVKAILQGRRA